MTFLAYGNGAPDIFSALAALSHSKSQNGVQLGIQALFGKMLEFGCKWSCELSNFLRNQGYEPTN